MKDADSKVWDNYQLSSGMERKYVDLASGDTGDPCRCPRGLPMPQGRGMLTGKSAEVVVEAEPRRTESKVCE